MKNLLSIIIIVFLTNSSFSQNSSIRQDSTSNQEYLLKIYNSRTNKKTYYRKVGDKVKISATNLKGNDRIVKAKILLIKLDSIGFQPRNKRYQRLILNIKDLNYIEIRTPGMIIGYSLSILLIIIPSKLEKDFSHWRISTFRKIDFMSGKWSKEIIPENWKKY